MLVTCGHQTLEFREKPSDRKILGPLKSIWDESKKHKPFAGDGYYFWDNNIDAAKWFGEKKYRRNKLRYHIFRIDINLRYEPGGIYDLVGNRNHQIDFLKRVRNAKKHIYESKNWKFVDFIEYFRKESELLEQAKNIKSFNYSMLRFNDDSQSLDVNEMMKLSDKQHFLYLNPFYIICVFDISHLDLNSYNFVDASN